MEQHARTARFGIRRLALVLVMALVGTTLVDCGRGSSSGQQGGNGTASVPTNLTAAQVQQIILQAANEATARGTPATIAVVDRVGNVLGVMQQAGAPTSLTVSSQRGVASSGLEGQTGIPATLAAISKAITGAYLSSNGNAFTTRTASQIIQENFNPGTRNQPGGPLFGVQFSQLPCSDLTTDQISGNGTLAGQPGPGPHRSPLGLAGDPGGLPLYINNQVVGGIGVVAASIYGLSAFPTNGSFDNNGQELIAIAGQSGFTPPDSIIATRISVGGLTLRYTDADSSQLARKPVSSDGTYTGVAVTGYYAGGGTLNGTTFLTAASGVIRDPANIYPGVEAYVLVDNAGNVRFQPTAGAAPAGSAITAVEARQLVVSALTVAISARAQIRQPLNSFVQVTVSVVDTNGNILAMARTPDAPIFGTDVSLQKARTAMFFSRATAGAEITAASTTLAGYITASNSFGVGAFTGANAWSARGIGNISRPFYPDGINGNSNGPLSRPFASWSPFTDGLQVDLIGGNVLAQAGGATAPTAKCGGAEAFGGTGGLPRVGATGATALANGIQIFAGGVPLYRGSTLVGGLGVSGDGIDQDDMTSFLGAARAGGAVGNAPTGIRDDQLNPGGQGNLRYVNCPFSPFLNDTTQNPCAGL
ncbi:MAG: heme-binding protein [Alphaproteobacteria bacterium]|nr:heme-binding protein [Alphaproteobacteria bacterium]